MALQVPPDAREYGPETKVVTPDAEGQLVSLSADHYTNRISELRANGLLAQEVVVPERWIGDLRLEAISLSATTDQLDQLISNPAGNYVARQTGSQRQVSERNREQR